MLHVHIGRARALKRAQPGDDAKPLNTSHGSLQPRNLSWLWSGSGASGGHVGPLEACQNKRSHLNTDPEMGLVMFRQPTQIRSQIETLLLHTKGPKPFSGLSRRRVPNRNTAFPHQGSETEFRAFQTYGPRSKLCCSTPKARHRFPDFPDSKDCFSKPRVRNRIRAFNT